MLDAVKDGPLDLGYLQVKGKAMMARDFEPSFRLRLAAKDARLVEEAVDRHRLDLPLVSAIRRRLDEGVSDHGDKDMSATYLTSAPAYGVRCRDQDQQVPGPVYALHPVELDVRARRGPGDERDRRAALAHGGRQRGDRLGHELHDLSGADDADVVVGDEREQAPPASALPIEHERAGLGDRHRAPGHRAVDGVKLGRAETRVLDHLHVARAPWARQLGRHHDAAQPHLRARGADGVGQPPGAHRPHLRLVVGHPLGEALHQRVAGQLALAAVVTRDRHIAGTLGRRDVAEGGPDATEDLLARGAHGQRSRHH